MKRGVEHRPLVVLGIDGLWWGLYDFIKKVSNIPNIRNLIRHMQRRDLISTIPPHTAIAWTTIFTGVNPGKHGVFGFLKFNSLNSSYRLTTSGDIKKPLLWELLNGIYRKPQLVINAPLSSPFRKFKGVGIPDWLSPVAKFNINNVSNETKQIILKNRSDLLSYTGKLWPILQEDPEALLQIIIDDLRKRVSIYREILNNEDWSAIIIVFSEIDWIQHISSLYIGKRQYLKYLQKYASKAFEVIDAFTKDLLNLYDGKSTVYAIVSDHGFQFYDKIVMPARILIKAKLMSTSWLSRLVLENNVIYRLAKISITLSNKFSRKSSLILWRFARKQNLADISKSPAYIQRDLFGTGIRINKILLRKKGLKYPTVVRWIIELFKKVNSKLDALSLIAKRSDIYWGKYVIWAPDVILLPKFSKKFWLSSELSKEIITKEFMASHNMKGVFGIYSDGIVLKEGSVQALDVLGIILDSLNIDRPHYIDSAENLILEVG